jgi:uncharacterized FlgJ-related protein
MGYVSGSTLKDQPFMHPKTKSCWSSVEALVEEISKHPALSQFRFSSNQISRNPINAPHTDNSFEGYP